MKTAAIILLCIFLLILPATYAATVRPVLELSEAHLTTSQEPTVSYQTSTEECPIDSTARCDHSNQVRNDTTLSESIISDSPERLRVRVNDIDKLNSRSSKTNPEVLSADKTLRQVILLHRHGDRTPINFPSKDPLQTEPFWTFHGLGQLTNRGKERLHLLGRLMRLRYNKFMNNSVNKNQVTSRSSGSLRCIESAQTFLSGFLDISLEASDAHELIWDKPSNKLSQIWQPASVQTVPVAIDGMLAEGSTCVNLAKEYERISSLDEAKKILADYSHEAEVLNSLLGFELDLFYKWFWASSLIEVERSYFPDKIQPKILNIYDRVQDAGNKGLKLYQSSLKSKRLRGGLLIGDIVRHLDSYRDLVSQNVNDDSSTLKRFVHYSAHDLTNVVLLGMLGDWDQFGVRPDYASNIAIELHQDKDQWFVRAFYMATVPSEPLELRLEQCYTEAIPASGQDTRRCTLDKFKEMVEPYLIDSWLTWMKECGNDFANINPYETTH